MCSSPVQSFSRSTQLRLNGSSPCAGRVEVLYNRHWGRVCSHSWDLPDAEVVCKQLGCGAAVSAPHSKRPGGLPEDRVLNRVGCLGNETQLRECKSGPWGRKDCQHEWDAAVICAESQEGKEALERGGTKEIQLGIPYSCASRVQLYYRGQWGAICWNDFGIKEAQVVCRQAGCGEAETYSRFYVEINDAPIWLDRVHCAGNETNLWDCPSDTWGHHECDLRMQAAVICKGAINLSLADGGSPCAGRLESYTIGKEK
ncbi:scavenger receptor cysteine-rich type 1 protein M130-like [Polyodon spathula]|uniref:scavenger receptor cysteine-rich type 1 protein M130-like n=1 Tax=Polyodon spathula TaxID=7913 RepID=UPI001B7DF94C|nr:scavenger receptor cysteine-rich type 1 protein M130-like [Polyodon spathula]